MSEHHHHHHGPAKTLNTYVLVLSDKGSRGEREDLSGPALANFLNSQGHHCRPVEILPDEEERIARRLKDLCVVDTSDQALDLILTCGGTGVSPRDVTPEATRQVISQEIPGFGEQMRRASLEKSSHAIISRALAGICGQTLIINLPGSPKAALENLNAVWPAVGHLIAKLQGDPSDCAAP